ncbi:hypothetical protein FRB99_003390 [Tulasnella sp. 403]|nr:hypothetical protein FRB99_003390 [Tulasnella sp. 403]
MAPDFTAGDASARLLLPAEEQPHTLSITVSTDSRTTSTQVANRSLSDSNSVTPPGPIPCANPEDLVDATLDAL